MWGPGSRTPVAAVGRTVVDCGFGSFRYSRVGLGSCWRLGVLESWMNFLTPIRRPTVGGRRSEPDASIIPAQSPVEGAVGSTATSCVGTDSLLLNPFISPSACAGGEGGPRR